MSENKMIKKRAVVDSRRCVACGACMAVCPIQAVTVPDGCFARVQEERCVGCGRCSNICPAGCISILEKGQEEQR
ncbi:MAG: 4Fe-4S binding protein [Lachnospiraceae bacterium]|nr:4Fe-4S binding protein [Lachnospiraceae bacterium]